MNADLKNPPLDSLLTEQNLADLHRLARTPQDPVHHAEGDVWTHTRMVVEAMLQTTTWQQAGASDRFVLFMAALLHDIAKPATTVVDPVSGRIGQPGHSARGVVDARVLLWRAGVPFGQREAICRLIAVHQVPFFTFKANRAGHSPEFIVRKLSHEVDLVHLAALAEADMTGRQCADQVSVLDDIELFRELARQEGCYGQSRPFADEFTRMRYLSGEALGLVHGCNDGRAVHFATDKARALLRQQAPFVWNATHLSRQMRAKTLDLLLAYHARATVVYLEQPEEVLLRRNRLRDSTLPNAAIGRMLHRWEVVLPSEAHEVRYEGLALVKKSVA